MSSIEICNGILSMLKIGFRFPRVVIWPIPFPTDLVEGTATHNIFVNYVIDEVFLSVVNDFRGGWMSCVLFGCDRRAIGGEEDFIEDGIHA